MSEAHNSSSPAPSSVPQIRIPDDSMIIRYESVDPTRVLDNPSHLFGDTFYDQHVDEKVGSLFGGLLTMYQKLAYLNADITIQNIKFFLQQDDMKNSEIYDLLDEFYVDLPNVNYVNSSWLNATTLSVLLEKQTLHKTIKQNLELLQTALAASKKNAQPKETTVCKDSTSHRKKTENQETESNDEDDQEEDDDDEITTKHTPLPKLSKKGKNKRKNK